MQTLNITHAHYRGKIIMIQAGSELEFYDNKGVLIEKHTCRSVNEACELFNDNALFYTGHRYTNYCCIETSARI